MISHNKVTLFKYYLCNPLQLGQASSITQIIGILLAWRCPRKNCHRLYKATIDTLFKYCLYNPLQLGQASCGITKILIPGIACQGMTNSDVKSLTLGV